LDKPPRVRIIVLNYRGETLLPQCLPSIVEAAAHASNKTAVAILDNPSDQSGIEYCLESYPDVDVYRAPENKVLCSFNEYLPKIKEPIVILLNNDIRVDKDFVDPLVACFDRDEKTFLVAPRVMSFDGSMTEAGRSRSGVRLGVFWCDARYPGYQDEIMTPSQTDSSGFGAFSRETFIRLGGYDERFQPGILEDVDLCFRAKKEGYHLYYEPSSVVYHMGQASFQDAFGRRGVAEIGHRNTFLFMWKHFRGLKFWCMHLFFLPVRFVWAILKGHSELITGFFFALKRQGSK